MFCPNCGRELPQGSAFCPACGTSVRPATPVNVQPAQPNYAQPAQPNYAQPVYASSYARPRPSDTRWPAGIGVMSVLYLVFYLGYLACLLLYFHSLYMPVGEMIRSYIVPLILAIAVPVLFFVHTKKLAFLTAIPVVLSLVFSYIGILSIPAGFLGAEQVVRSFIPLGFQTLLAIFYVIQMIVRPHSPALSILYLIFGILSLVFSAVLLISGLVSGYRVGYWEISDFCHFIGSIFLVIAYSMAMFRSRRQ